MKGKALELDLEKPMELRLFSVSWFHCNVGCMRFFSFSAVPEPVGRRNFGNLLVSAPDRLNFHWLTSLISNREARMSQGDCIRGVQRIGPFQ